MGYKERGNEEMHSSEEMTDFGLHNAFQNRKPRAPTAT